MFLGPAGENRNARVSGRGRWVTVESVRHWGLGGSGARVRLIVVILHCFAAEVRVDLGGAEALVPEHLLDAAQIGSASQHVGGEAVTQRVGADREIEAGFEQVLVQLAADATSAQSLPVLVDEQSIGVELGAARIVSPEIQEMEDRLHGSWTDRNDSTFLATH